MCGPTQGVWLTNTLCGEYNNNEPAESSCTSAVQQKDKLGEVILPAVSGHPLIYHLHDDVSIQKDEVSLRGESSRRAGSSEVI